MITRCIDHQLKKRKTTDRILAGFFFAGISIRYSLLGVSRYRHLSSSICSFLPLRAVVYCSHIYFPFSDTPRDLWRLFYFTGCRTICCLFAALYNVESHFSRDTPQLSCSNDAKSRANDILGASTPLYLLLIIKLW